MVHLGGHELIWGEQDGAGATAPADRGRSASGSHRRATTSDAADPASNAFGVDAAIVRRQQARDLDHDRSVASSADTLRPSISRGMRNGSPKRMRTPL